MTNEELRALYLKDLREGVNPMNGKKKVHRPDQWARINEELVEGMAEAPLNWKEVLLQAWRGERDVWVWSDIHFGHHNIIRYCGRPFPNTTLMNQCLEGNYKNVVKPQDICIFGGDIAFMPRADVEAILTRLPGKKILVVGNHDIHHGGLTRYMGFAEYHVAFVMPIEDEGFELLFTHYPLDVVPNGCINVHGHIHNHLIGGRHINMCVEHTNYAPKNIKDIITYGKALYEKFDL